MKNNGVYQNVQWFLHGDHVGIGRNRSEGTEVDENGASLRDRRKFCVARAQRTGEEWLSEDQKLKKFWNPRM